MWDEIGLGDIVEGSAERPTGWHLTGTTDGRAAYVPGVGAKEDSSAMGLAG